MSIFIPDNAKITRSPDHHYTYLGETYPGVTGLLKVIDKSDALMSWAARNTAEAAVLLASTIDGDGKNSLSGLVDTVGVEGAVKALTARSAWKRDEAAALGTEVHNLADLVVRGEPTPAMPEITRSRVLKYAEWWKGSGWTLRSSEAEVVNTVEGYGGTIDLLARDPDGKTVLADIKTGKAIYWEAVLQLCAYSRAEVIQHAGRVFPMPVVDRYVILHVTANEVRPVEVPVGGLEWQAFLACMDLTRWRESQKGARL